MIFLGNQPVGISALVSSTLKKANGEFDWNSTLPVTIIHNLGTRKVLIVMQRVNTDYSVIIGADDKCVAVLAATKEAIQWNENQTYRHTDGTAVGFNDIGSEDTYASGLCVDFPGADDTTLSAACAIQRPDRGAIAADINTLTVHPGRDLMPGRWVWTAYAVG